MSRYPHARHGIKCCQCLRCRAAPAHPMSSSMAPGPMEIRECSTALWESSRKTVLPGPVGGGSSMEVCLHYQPYEHQADIEMALTVARQCRLAARSLQSLCMICAMSSSARCAAGCRCTCCYDADRQYITVSAYTRLCLLALRSGPWTRLDVYRRRWYNHQPGSHAAEQL